MGRHRELKHKGHTNSINIITRVVGVGGIVYGILLGLYLILRAVGSLPSFAIPVYRFVYAVRGWNIEHSWIVPVLLVVLGIIVLYRRSEAGRGRKGHSAKSSQVWRKLRGAVRYGKNMVLYRRSEAGRGRKGHSAKSSEVWRKLWGAVRYGNNRSLIIKVLVLAALIAVVFTIKLPLWAWLGIGILMAGILPQILMFVIFNLIARAIWRR